MQHTRATRQWAQLLAAGHTDVICGAVALLAAVRGGHYEVVRLLAARPAFLAGTDSQGANALHVAVQTGNADMVSLLLSTNEKHLTRGVNLSFGCSPLHLAVQTRREDITELLLEADPSPISAVDRKSGWTVLHQAIASGASVRLVEKLYLAYPQALFVSGMGKSPLTHLLHFSSVDAVFDYLIRRVSLDDVRCVRLSLPLILEHGNLSPPLWHASRDC